ncbi:MAG: putative zinc-binding metallopeptidase, partial [Thalassolituus sp.]
WLVKPNELLLAEFEQHFGDPNLSYKDALEAHYQRDQNDLSWQPRFISAYASMHPWEDWAETFAHYLHITDTLETAREWQMIALSEYDGLILPQDKTGESDPDALFKCWIRLSVKLNALNRSMGVADAYPFVMTPEVVEKLKFVHKVVVGL